MLILSWMARVLPAPIFAVAAALLVRGYSETGGGVAAGVIAGMAIWLCIVGVEKKEERARILPWAGNGEKLVIAGLLFMAGVTFFPLFQGEPILSHVPGPSEPVTKFGSIELHTALLFELGMALVAFGFVSGVAHLLKKKERE